LRCVCVCVVDAEGCLSFSLDCDCCDHVDERGSTTVHCVEPNTHTHTDTVIAVAECVVQLISQKQESHCID